MKNFFEIVMLVCFCAALVVMTVRFLKRKTLNLFVERIMVVAMGLGFLFGIIGKVIAGSADWTIILYVVGLHLSYTATIFSLKTLTNENEVADNE